MFREMFCNIMIRVMFCASIKYHWGAFLPPPSSCHHLYCHHCHPTCKSTIIICITTQHTQVCESISTIIILVSISMICIDLDTQHTPSRNQKITFHFTRPDIRYPDKGLQESFNSILRRTWTFFGVSGNLALFTIIVLLLCKSSFPIAVLLLCKYFVFLSWELWRWQVGSGTQGNISRLKKIIEWNI